MPAHVSALAVGHLLHEYRIERLLGHGGFGLTYLALDTNLNALVAIKEFLPQEFAVRSANSSVIPKSESDADSYKWGLDRFKEEARALARFKHPNIVRAARLVEANGTAYMVMEFEPGMTLSQYLKRVSPVLDESHALGLFLPVLDGLEALHEAELVHRDIKPSNIYLRVRGGPMLIDFGAVRHAIGAHSRSLTAVVTPGYAPIEQYSSEGRQGPWSDLYAMGATMYCAMFGHPPMDAAQRSAAISDGGDDPYVSAASLGGGRFSGEFLGAVDWALSFRVRDRPQGAEAFRKRLAEAKQKPKPVSVPKELEDEPGLQGIASDRSKQPVQVPPQELKTPTPSEDSAVMLKAHSGRPKEPDPDKTDIGAVAATLDGKSRGAPTEVVKPPPKSEPLDFELPAEEPADEAPEKDAATEVIPKSPILERMGSGIRRAQTVKPAAAPEPVPKTSSPRTGTPRTGIPKTSRPSPFKEPPRESTGKKPYLLIAVAVILLLLIGVVVGFYQHQRAGEEALYEWASGVDTTAAYQQYLQTCHICPHHADAQEAIDRLENLDKFTRLKTDFELLLLKKALTPPAEPNATDVLNELATMEPQNVYVAQARSELAAAIPHAPQKPAARPLPVSAPTPKPAAPAAVVAKNVAPPPAPQQNAVAQKPVSQPQQNVGAQKSVPQQNPVQQKPAAQSVPQQTVVLRKPVPQTVPQQSATNPMQAAPMPAAPAAAPAPAAPVIKEPKPVSTPDPQYPRDALLSGVTGWVDLEFTVNTDGSVSDPTVLDAQPVIVFNKSALHAVVGWRFTPYTVNGVPQAKRIHMRVDFKR